MAEAEAAPEAPSFQESTREWTDEGARLMTEAARSGAPPIAPEPASDGTPRPEPSTREANANKSTNARLTAETAQRHAARNAARREMDMLRRQVAQTEAHILPVAQRYQELKRAEEAGDLDGMARALGHADWAAFQQDKIERLSNPSYGKTLELERRLAEREAREQRAEQERAAQVQAQQQQAARQQYMARMSEEARASAHPVLREFAGSSALLSELFAVRSALYQQTGEEASLERCIEQKRANGLSILDELEGYAATADRFRAARKGTTAAKPAEAAKRAPATEKRSAVRSDLRPWERNRRQEDAEWDARAARSLQEAFDAEKRREA